MVERARITWYGGVIGLTMHALTINYDFSRKLDKLLLFDYPKKYL